MAIVRKYLAKDDYTKIDNQVARNRDVSDFSKVLYLFAAGFKNGFQLNDEYIGKALGWSVSKVARAKLDLRKADLMLIEKVNRGIYFLYIGNSKVSASKVKANWEAMEKGEWE